MSALKDARRRYGEFKDWASAQAVRNVAPDLGLDVHLNRWGPKAAEALERQWGSADRDPVATWDGAVVSDRAHREPKSLDMALWTGDGRLCALALASLGAAAVTLRFVEGDPRVDCPYKGRRLPVLLEATVLYGQRTGRGEIRIEPINPALEVLYESLYGFKRESPRNGPPFFYREI